MSPRTAQQIKEIRKDRKQSIMVTALEEFATHGYETTSISMIAKKAGVSKGLMYNYFKSKEDLLSKIMEEGFEDMLPFIDPNKDGVLTKEEFAFMIDESFRLMKEKISFYRLYFSLIMQPAVSKLFAEKLNQVAAPFIELFVNYYKEKGSKNPMLEAIMVGALLDGIGFNYAFNADAYPLDDVVELVKEKFV
ncbi:MAG TPA: TetR/AcrR family transcriptional regulator [Bacteroidales bacterium]